MESSPVIGITGEQGFYRAAEGLKFCLESLTYSSYVLAYLVTLYLHEIEALDRETLRGNPRKVLQE